MQNLFNLCIRRANLFLLHLTPLQKRASLHKKWQLASSLLAFQIRASAQKIFIIFISCVCTRAAFTFWIIETAGPEYQSGFIILRACVAEETIKVARYYTCVYLWLHGNRLNPYCCWAAECERGQTPTR